MKSALVRTLLSLAALTSTAALGLAASAAEQAAPVPAEPRVINPGPPPSDAIVLFDGKDLSQWKSDKGGGPAVWAIKDGAAMVNGTGNISTRQEFGDCQLHVEWATPLEVTDSGQKRGNSGIFLQGRYEVQVLDSYDNKTYLDGQAGAVYKQHVPLVNVSRKPGEWQTYDIIYHAPRFGEAGELLKAATLTLLHNGVLVQDGVAIRGPTSGKKGKYEPHPLKQPLVLQDHKNPVQYRNVWIREL